jgi:hypothetical protein
MRAVEFKIVETDPEPYCIVSISMLLKIGKYTQHIVN